MNDIRFSLKKDIYFSMKYSYIIWSLLAEEETLLVIYTMHDGREITPGMAAHGIKPLRNCRRWPTARASMLRFVKKELAVQAASTGKIEIPQKVYKYLKENYKKIFAGDDQ